MKRFYKLVTTAPHDGGFAVHLDGKPVKTPAGHTLRAPQAALADAIMAEWAAQGDVIAPDTMPLTQILTTAQDRAIPQRDVIMAEVLNYLDTDLLCYRADRPDGLVAAQAAQGDPVLAWFADKYGAALQTTTGLAALRQPAVAHDAARAAVAAMDDMRFAVFQMVVSVTGSIVLALAFIDGVRDADALFAAMHVEEDFKAQIYNEDFYGRAPQQEKRESAVRRDLAAAQAFIGLLD
jgi:chaperone required for assembly of F1-ATPase